MARLWKKLYKLCTTPVWLCYLFLSPLTASHKISMTAKVTLLRQSSRSSQASPKYSDYRQMNSSIWVCYSCVDKHDFLTKPNLQMFWEVLRSQPYSQTGYGYICRRIYVKEILAFMKIQFVWGVERNNTRKYNCILRDFWVACKIMYKETHMIDRLLII